MNLVKWDPFYELEGIQTRLNRLFGDLPARRTEEADFFGNWAPAVDIHETDAEYTVKADLPDVRKEDVKVELDNGVLTVEGERKQEKEEKGKKFHKVERAYGRFVRRFALPTEIDGTKVQAEFKDGVLKIRLPKAAAAKPTTVDVKVA
jgi:HSP20 family protein